MLTGMNKSADVALFVLAISLPSGAQEWRVSRYTIDGGGVLHSAGGTLELSSTIGQPDAGVLVGEGLELTGGFWFALPPCDGNDDGLVSQPDYQAFESCMTGPSAETPTDECRVFDCNRDGTIALDDYSELQAHFTGD